MGKGDIKSRRGKVTNGSYGKTRPRKRGSSASFVAKPKDVKPASKVKEVTSNADRDTVNFSEDHELNYHLKKNGLSSSKDNRAKLVELGSALKVELGKKILTHEEVDGLIIKNIGDFKAVGQK